MSQRIGEKKNLKHFYFAFSAAFENKIGRYNGTSGKVRAHVNKVPIKPPTKALKVPNY